MPEVIVRPGAQTDIREAALWYESQQPGLGSEFILRFDALVERIAQNPLQFPEIGSSVRRALLQRFPYAITSLLQPPRLLFRCYIRAATLTRGNGGSKTTQR